MTTLNKVLNILCLVPGVQTVLNRLATNWSCSTTPARPRSFSLWSEKEKPIAPFEKQAEAGTYTSWPMLVNRDYSKRHLPPASTFYIDSLPVDHPPNENGFGQITSLFKREGEMKTDRSSMFFVFFAQWFTDSVLRVHPIDRRKNTSNHNVDLCQIYGLTEETCKTLRAHQGGLLTSQQINGEEFPDYLGEIVDNQWQVKEKYQSLPYVTNSSIYKIFESWTVERKEKIFATGLERGNSSIGYISLSTIFLREHNRIALELADYNPSWDDERLFQTARMINTVILMKLVVEDYVRHISGYDLIKFDRSFAEKQNWYRAPWISIEFDLLYRWHGLIPDSIKINGDDVSHQRYRGENSLLEKLGVSELIDVLSTQKGGKICLSNSPGFILPAEYQMIKMGRDFKLQSFNAYREKFGLRKYNSFEELTDDQDLKAKLKKLYNNDIDSLEYVVGLFAEKAGNNKLYGDLIGKMVAYDAFTQIYTNPLLSSNVYHSKTFTEYGLKLIDETSSFQALIDRNTKKPSNAKFGI